MKPLTAYAFRDPTFSPDGDTHVCVIERRALSKYMGVRELRKAFSGAVFYRQSLWTSYVGVWGRRNGKRLRRFLHERGAIVVIERARPERTRIERWSTLKVRARVRQLAAGKSERTPIRTALFLIGSLLALATGTIQLSQPLMAAGFMWTLREVNWPVVAILTPSLISGVCALGGIMIGYRMLRARRTLAMMLTFAAVIVVVPLVAAAVASLLEQAPPDPPVAN